jgi:hypothetical protein
MLPGGGAHFGAEPPAAFRFGIKTQDALVALAYSGAAVVFETRFSRQYFTAVERIEAPAYHCDSGIGKDYSKRDAALEIHWVTTGRIDSGNMSLIRRLMQKKYVIIDVAGNEDRQMAYLHSMRINQRQPMLIEFDTNVSSPRLSIFGRRPRLTRTLSTIASLLQ